MGRVYWFDKRFGGLGRGGVTGADSLEEEEGVVLDLRRELRSSDNFLDRSTLVVGPLFAGATLVAILEICKLTNCFGRRWRGGDVMFRYFGEDRWRSFTACRLQTDL